MKKVVLIAQGIKIHEGSILQSFEMAFSKLGFEVTIHFMSNKYLYGWYSKLFLLNSFILWHENQKIIDLNRKFDAKLIFVVKGTYLFPSTIRKLSKSNNKKVICFNPDNPYNLKARGASNNRVIKSIPFYHIYLIWDNQLKVKIEKDFKVKTIVFPFSVSEDIFFPLEEVYKKYAISFIGNADKERQDWVNAVTNLSDWHRLSLDFHLFGNDWQSGKGIIIHKPVYGNEYVNVINQTILNINFLRLQNKNSINMRTFEIPACKALMLHEQSDEAQKYFEADKECIYFKNPEELMNKISSLINNSKLQAVISQNAYNKVYSHGYTYQHQIKNLLLNKL